MHKNKWFPGILTEKEAAVMVKVGMYAICNLLFPPFFFPPPCHLPTCGTNTDMFDWIVRHFMLLLHSVLTLM